MEDWIKDMPDRLRLTGASLADYGVPEVCFGKADAVAVIEVMRQGEMPCLGGDEWSCVDNTCSPTGRSWYVVRNAGESDDRLKERSWAEARAFAAGLTDPDSRVVFVVGPYREPEPVLPHPE